jgi:phasin family protein
MLPASFDACALPRFLEENMTMTTTLETRVEKPLPPVATAAPSPTATPTAAPPTPATPPKFDLRAMLEKLRLPGVDAQKLIEAHRKDLDALLAANERAVIAIEALTRKQADMLAHVVKEWHASARDAIAHGSGAEKLNQASARLHNAFAQALTNMREMAEIASKSGQDVLAVLNKRYHETIEEFRAAIHPKS